ncbi:MAG: TonB-dependent receptor [Gemmatimonadetes bacterium]|nr:TonB-dependent receptor [Gemmatimonadota bacterium]
MRVSRVGSLGTLFLALLLPGALTAQQGVISGTVTDVGTGRPVPTAQVQILGGAAPVGALTNQAGVYRIEVAPGTYSIVVEEVGHRPERVDGVRVTAGQTTVRDIQLTSQALELDKIVVSSSRGVAERQIDAPATTHVVGTTEIEERPVATLAEHLRGAPGVDIITEGIQSNNVVIRGFNNIFSGSLHMMEDHRLAGVPSLRVNLMNFIPANNDDVERMEVVLGPGSALYGPNTADGVLQILTKSPLDYQGTTVNLAGGERDVFDGSFRSAFLLSDNLGFKISGQYLRGNDWHFTDATEAAAHDTAMANPAKCLAALAIRGYDAPTAQTACERVGIRNFNIRRYSVEARTDWRFADDGTVILTYGRTDDSGIELTGLGAGQTKNWIYSYYQARLNKGRLFAQTYLNTSDAGNTFLLKDGVPLVDKSRLFVAQIQHGFGLGDGRQDFAYGVDYFHTVPRTDGTINGIYENKDNVDEWGVYLQSKTALTPKLDLVLAGRVDDHSMLPKKVWSPRAALVFKPTPQQSVRFAYNRAFSTPTTLNFFLDISGGAAREPLGSLGYTTRAFGTGANGFGFHNPDGSLQGMRSPFNPGGANQLLPISAATSFWGAAVAVAAAGAAQKGTPLPPDLVALLSSLHPGAADIPLGVLDPLSKQVTPLSSTTIPDVPGIRESHTETYEVGWQGVIQNKLRLSADVYRMRRNNFVSPLVISTPLLTLDGAGVGAYITTPIVTALTQQLIAAGLDPATAQAQAIAQAQQLVPVLATAIASVPVGVVSSNEVDAQGADIIVTYRNVGDINLWGADLGFEWFLNDQWTLTGTYSHMSKDDFAIPGSDPIALNAPKDKGTLGLGYRNVLSGFNASGRMRFASSFPAASADYNGDVPSSALFDLDVGYKVPNTAATLQLSVSNLFDTPYRSFVGVPDIGRLALLRIKYNLF